MDFERQMNEVVKMADVLCEVDEQPIDRSQNYAFLRHDIVSQSCLTEDSISQNAPSFKNGCFCVPKTVE
jgi:aspartyl/glutamyl-tRNA(Asn/Gln) amidotransferase C subunit